MNKHPWEVVYDKKQFSINTFESSIIIAANKNLFYIGDKVLDIGCGNGRNSIYLANLGCRVDSFDVADLQWREKLSPSIKEKINFTKTEIDNFKWENNYYNAIIFTRVLQYLSLNEINALLNNVFNSLTTDGFLILNYAVKGAIQKHKEIKIKKFSHSIKTIENCLRKYFSNILISQGSAVSIHTNLKGDIESYNIIAFKSEH